MTSPHQPETEPKSVRAGVVFGVIGLITVLIVIAVALLGDDPTTASTEPSGALDAAPSLQDLAGLAEDAPQDADAAPDFSVRTHDGGAFTLSRHLEEDGRPVILNLWASWCFPCREEMPAIDAFAAGNPEVKVVGVAVQDDAGSAADFADELGVTYTIGFDEKDEVNVEYRPLGLPATFFISTEGIVVKRIFGGVTEESLAEDSSELFGT